MKLEKNPKFALTPEQVRQYLALLEQRYPRVFDLSAPSPLKLQIHLDIRADLRTVDLPEDQELRKNKVLSFVLGSYCREPEYLRGCLATDAARVDLVGQGTEQKVSEREKQYVQGLLAQLLQKK